MRGLLEKDICLLKASRQTLAVFLLLAVLVGMSQPGTFILGYLPLCMMLLLTGTISCDEADHGFSFLFTLPVDRRLYIREKYVFCMAGALGSFAISGIIYFVSGKVHGTAMHPAEDAAMFPICLAVIFFALAVMIPVQVKYGIEKARIVIAGLCFAMAGCILFVQKIDDGAALEKGFARLDQIRPMTGAIGSLAISFVFLSFSYWVSTKIMEKKEF